MLQLFHLSVAKVDHNVELLARKRELVQEPWWRRL
jgi:hypothetical protein